MHLYCLSRICLLDVQTVSIKMFVNNSLNL